MRRILILSIVLLLVTSLAGEASARRNILVDPDYDPRVEMRVVVLPAQKARSLRRVNERTISALFATELLRRYEVLDLIRFENYLQDRKLTLDDALTQAAEDVVRDSAHVDAIASVEVYRWEPGTPGLPLLERESGRIGVRARVMDPFTGRIYWSVNRVEKVSPGTDFLDRATDLFRDMVGDLDVRLATISRELNEQDTYETMLASGEWPRLESYGDRKFTTAVNERRGFVPRRAARAVEVAMRRELENRPRPQPGQEQEVQTRQDPRDLLPPLFENGYEDVEKDTPAPQVQPTRREPARPETTRTAPPPVGRFLRETPATGTGLNGPPPMPSRFRQQQEQPAETPAGQNVAASGSEANPPAPSPSPYEEED